VGNQKGGVIFWATLQFMPERMEFPALVMQAAK